MRILFFLFLFTTNSIFPQVIFSMGSCNNQNDPQSYWDLIAGDDSEYWIWLGDIIYADNYLPNERREEYLKLRNNNSYQNFLNSKEVVTGLWDDHDYGYNNADETYLYKNESKDALLEFLDVDLMSPVFEREGIYRKDIFRSSNLDISLYLLDNRSFLNTHSKTLLGEAQWTWLENELSNDESDLILIASGINILNNFSLQNYGLEGWSYFREERKRLLDLVYHQHQNVILLSGDRHHSSLSRINYRGRLIYEYMVSGLTHTYSGILPNFNQLGRKVNKVNYGKLIIHTQNRVDFEIIGLENNNRLYFQEITLPH